MIFQETGDIIWGHINGVLASNSRGVVTSDFATSGMVRHFLATDTGLVSFNFAIETLVFLYKLFLFGVGMCLSHSVGINVHGISPLEGRAWSRSSVSSILVIFPLVWFGYQPKGLVESLFC